MVKEIRHLEKLLGERSIKINDEEIDNKSSRRSIVAKRDLKRGNQLAFDDIDWVRPGGGLKPGEENKLINKFVTQDFNPVISLFYLK